MSTLTEQKDEWEVLMKNPAWIKLEALLKEQAASRINQIVLTPLESADAVYNQEFLKGEVAAMQLAARLPELEVERLKAEIQELNEQGES